MYVCMYGDWGWRSLRHDASLTVPSRTLTFRRALVAPTSGDSSSSPLRGKLPLFCHQHVKVAHTQPVAAQKIALLKPDFAAADRRLVKLLTHDRRIFSLAKP